MKYCNKCGTRIKKETKYCQECGKKIPLPKKEALPTYTRFELSTKTFIALMSLCLILLIGELGLLNHLDQPKTIIQKEIIHDLPQQILTQNTPTANLEPPITPTVQENKPPTLTLDNVELESKTFAETKYKVKTITITINTHNQELQDDTLHLDILNKNGKNPLTGREYLNANLPIIPEGQTFTRQIDVDTPYLPTVQANDPLTLKITLKNNEGKTIATATTTTNTGPGTRAQNIPQKSRSSQPEIPQTPSQDYNPPSYNYEPPQTQALSQPTTYANNPVIQDLSYRETTPTVTNYRQETTPQYTSTPTYNPPAPEKTNYLDTLNQQFQQQSPFRKLPSGTSVGIQVYNQNWGSDQIIAEYKLTENGFTNGRGEDAIVGIKKTFLEGVLDVTDICQYAATHGKDDTQFRLISHNNWLSLGLKYGTQSRYCPNM